MSSHLRCHPLLTGAEVGWFAKDPVDSLPQILFSSLSLLLEPAALNGLEMAGSDEVGVDVKDQVLASGFKGHTFWLMAMDHCSGQAGWGPGLRTSRYIIGKDA